MSRANLQKPHLCSAWAKVWTAGICVYNPPAASPSRHVLHNEGQVAVTWWIDRVVIGLYWELKQEEGVGRWVHMADHMHVFLCVLTMTQGWIMFWIGYGFWIDQFSTLHIYEIKMLNCHLTLTKVNFSIVVRQMQQGGLFHSCIR